jgi:FtsP/CotA-like multicopper oxidase with cupredoxin domain
MFTSPKASAFERAARLIVAPVVTALLAGAASAQGTAFDPADAIDTNPDPNIFEFDLTAQISTWQYLPGNPTTVWNYNGQIPGPVIRAKVGDTLKVHFTNNLLEDTTIHWHGIDNYADMDGGHISQFKVPPGGTFDYEFPLNQEGMFWYHPHVRTHDQVEQGLYGVLIVEDPALEASLGIDTIEEHLVIFDDILLDSSNQVVPAFGLTDPLQNALYALNGREGNHLLVNGKVASTVNLPVNNGEPQRWRVLNVANTTFARLDLHQAFKGMLLHQIGSDGGLVSTPIDRPPITPLPVGPDHPILFGNDQEGILLVPGERMDVIFTPVGTEGAVHTVKQTDWHRGRHLALYDGSGNIVIGDDPLDGYYPDQDYFDLTLVGPDPGGPYYAPPPVLDPINVIDPLTSVGTLTPTMGHSSPDAAGNVILFTQAKMVMGPSGMTMMPLPAMMMTSKEAFDVEIGETWTWEITNLTHGDHPFHTHGFMFQPYEVEYFDTVNPGNNGIYAMNDIVWKDTVRVPPRPGAKGTSSAVVRAMVKFDDTGRVGRTEAHGETATADPSGGWTAGGWLFHCHILEHAALGMLSFFEVHEPGDPIWLVGRNLDGTNGKASLTANGTLVAGTPLTIDIVNAQPSTQMFLAIGFSSIDSAAFGGTVVPSPDIVDGTITTDGNGDATWNFVWPAGLASGSNMYLQVAFVDAGAPQGIALSNAIQLNIP